jgi:hypothetical protein
MQTPNFRATHNGQLTRDVAARLHLPWRVWLKIIAAIPALAVTTSLNVPDPIVNWILSAIVLVWISAYIVWHIK